MIIEWKIIFATVSGWFLAIGIITNSSIISAGFYGGAIVAFLASLDYIINGDK